MADAAAKAQSYIDNNAVVVFSKSYCPYCKKTKATLDSLKADYEVLELDLMDDGSDLQDALEGKSKNRERSVPHVWIKQSHISGGNSTIQSLNSSGELKKLLQDAGALQK